MQPKLVLAAELQGALNEGPGSLYTEYCLSLRFTSTPHTSCVILLKFHELTWENFIKKLYFFLEIPMWVLLVGRLHEILT